MKTTAQLNGRVFTRLQQYEALPAELKDEVERLEQYLKTHQQEVFDSHHTLSLKTVYGAKVRELLDKIDAWLKTNGGAHGRKATAGAGATGVGATGVGSSQHHDQQRGTTYHESKTGAATGTAKDVMHHGVNADKQKTVPTNDGLGHNSTSAGTHGQGYDRTPGHSTTGEGIAREPGTYKPEDQGVGYGRTDAYGENQRGTTYHESKKDAAVGMAKDVMHHGVHADKHTTAPSNDRAGDDRYPGGDDSYEGHGRTPGAYGSHDQGRGRATGEGIAREPGTYKPEDQGVGYGQHGRTPGTGAGYHNERGTTYHDSKTDAAAGAAKDVMHHGVHADKHSTVPTNDRAGGNYAGGYDSYDNYNQGAGQNTTVGTHGQGYDRTPGHSTTGEGIAREPGTYKPEDQQRLGQHDQRGTTYHDTKTDAATGAAKDVMHHGVHADKHKSTPATTGMSASVAAPRLTGPHSKKLLHGLVLKGVVTLYKEDKPDDTISGAAEHLDFKDGDLLVPLSIGQHTETTVWNLVDGAIFAGMLKRKAGLLEPITHGKDTYVVVNGRNHTLTLFASDLGREPIVQMNARTLKVAYDESKYDDGVKVWNGTDTELFNPTSQHQAEALVQALRKIGGNHDEAAGAHHPATMSEKVKMAVGGDKHTTASGNTNTARSAHTQEEHPSAGNVGAASGTAHGLDKDRHHQSTTTHGMNKENVPNSGAYDLSHGRNPNMHDAHTPQTQHGGRATGQTLGGSQNQYAGGIEKQGIAQGQTQHQQLPRDDNTFYAEEDGAHGLMHGGRQGQQYHQQQQQQQGLGNTTANKHEPRGFSQVNEPTMTPP